MTKHLLAILFLLSFAFYSCGTGQNTSKKMELTTKIGKIKFDESVTNFKQATVMSDALSKKYVYSLHGESDLKNQNPTTGFFIAPLLMNFSDAKHYLDLSIDGYGENYGIIKLENIKKKETKINNLKAYIITFSTVDKTNKKSYVTLAVLSNEKSSIEFSGNDFEDGIYSEKFMKTIESLEM